MAISGRRTQGGSTSVPNPANKFLEFQGSKGYYYFYDKAAKENVTIKAPKFLIVQECTTITGWNKANGGLWSNEVLDVMSEELDVKYHKGDNKNIAKGLYSDIKEKITSRNVGGKFTRSIYISLYHNKKWSLENIKLSGKQLTSWIALQDELKSKNIPTWKVMIEIDTIEFDDSGAIAYYYPTFKYTELDDSNKNQEAVLIQADNYYTIVEDFFKKRKEGIKANEPSKRAESQTTNEAKVEPKKEEPKPKAQDEDPFANGGDEDDDDLPF